MGNKLKQKNKFKRLSGKCRLVAENTVQVSVDKPENYQMGYWQFVSCLVKQTANECAKRDCTRQVTAQ